MLLKTVVFNKKPNGVYWCLRQRDRSTNKCLDGDYHEMCADMAEEVAGVPADATRLVVELHDKSASNRFLIERNSPPCMCFNVHGLLVTRCVKVEGETYYFFGGVAYLLLRLLKKYPKIYAELTYE